LPAGRLRVLEETYLRVERRVLRDHDQVIHGIQTEANRIKLFVNWRF